MVVKAETRPVFWSERRQSTGSAKIRKPQVLQGAETQQHPEGDWLKVLRGRRHLPYLARLITRNRQDLNVEDAGLLEVGFRPGKVGLVITAFRSVNPLHRRRINKLDG